MADKTAPERIWLQTGGNFAEAMRGEVTWAQDRINDDDEEYVRADPHLGGSFYKEADIDRLMERAEVAEAECKRLQTARKWKPIETAPPDGTPVLVYASPAHGLEGFMCVAAYHPSAGWCVDELREATHWMPLPLPPAPEGEA